ncbi:MAG TPA: CHAT domain-containing protein, partial [Thioploca sp.]|nr:CHAT domain-containing protein [Thioploca sp.]
MHQELNLEFTTENQVIVHFNDQHSDKLGFQSPVTEEDQKDIRWYLEVYAYLYTTDVDDNRAAKIAARLSILGENLLKSVFYNDKTVELFQQFHRQKNVGRLLTISASHPAILSLPWELLRFKDNYLFHDAPRISIRRRLANLDNAKKPLAFTAKTHLHLLFVVSRPQGASFIDPRTDPIAVLEALDQTGRMIEVEFLRPATLANLKARLKDNTKPPIDILHFDGHGAFNSTESMGYLLFTHQGSWTKHRVPATGLGLILGAANIPLVILSACQSAAIGDSEEPMGTVAVQLTHAGVPSVIAMTHSVHVNATRALFSAFYQHLTQGKGVGEALDNARSYLYQNPDRIELQRGQEHVTLKLYDWFLPALYQAGEDSPLLTTPIEVEQPAEIHWGNLHALQAAGFWGRTPELWQIECAFVQDGTRRFTISGFGGQGKTYLAIEAGQWLYRTGLFAKVCFVDYASFQGVDAVGWAVSTLATVLDKSLVDAQAATAALALQPTLLILDNVEAITAKSLSELLTKAKEWSEIGQCRVLLTTRSPDFHHPDYPTEGSLIHQSLTLGGLAED